MFGRLLLLSCCCAQLLSASGALGFAYVNGTYRSDGRSVRGNATLFDGTIIETDEAPAKLDLDDGTRAWLTPHSKIRVTARRLLLLEGLSEVHSVGSHDLAAGSINIRLKSDSITRVAVDATHGATVVSVRGTAAVSNANGVLVGSIGVGQSVRFTAYEGAAKIVQSSGCLERRGDGFALTDRVTNVTFRLNGRSLDDAVGRVISIRGYQEGQRADGTPTVKVTAVDHDGNISCGTSAHRPVLVAAARAAGGMQAPATKPVLNLVVVEGDGAINNIQQRTAREPIVEVQDENHRPIAGALVLFALPRSGPGGTFPNGATTLSVTTDEQGRAVARGLRPNDQSGQYNITVTASYAGATATATITQANAIAAAAATGAAGAGAGTAAGGASGGGAAAGGLALGSKIAIIAGVSATATVGGLAASGTIFGGSSGEPAASR